MGKPINDKMNQFHPFGDTDTGYRQIWENLGFAEEELLVEFGYPTQRFILQKPEHLTVQAEKLEAGEHASACTDNQRKILRRSHRFSCPHFAGYNGTAACGKHGPHPYE